MAIQIFNVCGRPLDSDTKQGTVKIFPGKPLTLESPMNIGKKMKVQIDSKLLKVGKVDPAPRPIPTSIDKDAMAEDAEKKAKLRARSTKAKARAKKGVEKIEPAIPTPPADDPLPPKADPYKGLKGDTLITAVMVDMIKNDDNLGSDGKPNQPVLEAKVQAINPKTKVSARKRNKLYKKLTK